MADRVFRAVLKYIDYATMEEYYHYTKPYEGDNGGRYANTAATRWKKENVRVGNQYIIVPATRKSWDGQIYNYTETQYTTWFEYADRWLEEVEIWKKV